MAIDECTRTFVELATNALPRFMEAMRADMKNPRSLSEFCKPGIGVKSIARWLGKQNDFSGCYVLLHEESPFYVGISRVVIARLRQHGTGKTHFDASLAYRMACDKIEHDFTRNEAMKDPEFRRAFAEAQELLEGSSVAFVEIDNPLELYLFEPYCAMELDTNKWNSFRTH